VVERIEAHPKIRIKGIRDGLLAILGEGAWPELRAALLDHIDQQSEFLRGARLALDAGSLVLKAVDLGQLRDALSERGVSLWAVLSSSPTTERTAQSLGLATRIPHPFQERTVHEQPISAHATPLAGEEAVFVHRTLRSGASLHHPGHVVIIGDVNPGAEIISGGNVLVWGRLRGMVHAGAQGDESAVVCALDLMPTQLRIAGQIAITPQRRGKPQPEMARLIDGRVVAEPWNPKRKG
jgi:septum site-determining protein MinC